MKGRKKICFKILNSVCWGMAGRSITSIELPKKFTWVSHKKTQMNLLANPI